jgi:hypothetical protein
MAAGTANSNAVAARMTGDRHLAKAICPAQKVMALAIAPTMTAATGPEPL